MCSRESGFIAAPGGSPHAHAQAGVAGEASDALRERRGVVDTDQIAIDPFRYDFSHAAGIAGDDRDPMTHRLDQYQSEALIAAWHHQDVGGPVVPVKVIVR